MAAIAKVVVDISLDREFDYEIPPALVEDVRLGSRVLVPFGRSEKQGYVVGLADESTVDGLKPLRDVIGRQPLINEEILALARWIAEYYCAPIEAAIRTVLPGAVRKRTMRFRERLYVTLTDEGRQPGVLDEVQRRAPKQAAVLGVLLSEGGMRLAELAAAAETTAATVRGLADKGLVGISKSVYARDPAAGYEILPTQPFALMPEQAAALEQIRRSRAAAEPGVVLVHGVTGSGKTEIYLQAIPAVLEEGKGVIVLVPEISLTPQTVERFVGRFGRRVAVLHSHLSEGERHDEWHRVHSGAAQIVIGARSAVFAPVHKLGLIVVDEEHDSSYKQEEAPRYHARDVAVMRGRMSGCAVVLGSATPSMASFRNALRGKYDLATLSHRVDHRQMPVMRVVDMRVEAQETGRVRVFSRDLVEAVRRRLDRAEQTIIFLNRRGFASSLLCPKCGFVATCRHCSVSLTYHRRQESLRCHICGYAGAVPARCPECADPSFRMAGLGTQRVEDVVRKIFPPARVERMDADTTTRKGSHARILGDFRRGKIDILIGTQMIAKGLDFPGVTLIGVVYADLSLHIPDFRAGERTFQLLTQVAGRAGRGDVPGEVLVQTYTPFHPAVQMARRLDYRGFYDQEIEFRRELQYPPEARMTCVTIRGRAEESVKFAAEKLAEALKGEISERVILCGPTPAPLARAKGYYRYQLMLRAPSARAISVPLRRVLETFKWPPRVHATVDVDALTVT